MSDDGKSNADSKPLPALRAFSRRLGWTSLRIQRHFSTEDDQKEFGVPPIITWYEAGRFDGKSTDLFFQINELPVGQTATYCAAVYAMQFRICTGWHSFRLVADNSVDIQRLEPWLHRRWFETSVDRRKYREAHPECANYSWKRIQMEGPPIIAKLLAGC